MRKICIVIVIVCVTLTVSAQTGGRHVYGLLDFSYSSRIAALGGGLISVYDDDASLIISNPSYISEKHHNSLSLHFTDFFNNVNYGSALYSRTFKKSGSFAVEMRYVGYGKFIETDEYGQELGTFGANDYALTIGWGRWLNEHFSIGANLKTILSSYESYTSFGIAADVAGSFYSEKNRLSLTLLFKNIGSELKPFTERKLQRPGFDIQLALSQRLEHLPVRYHISFHSLYKWNMKYVGADDPLLQQDALEGYKYPSKTAQFFDNFFRHLIFGIEIEPVKYVSLMFAYNHDRLQNGKIPQKKSMAGFSYGFSINIYSMRIGFSRAHYSVGATPNYFTFSFNINELNQLTKDHKKKKLERLN
ncbi:MAG: type IX secretion system protein PorQ [Bacteroidales bacterium]|jgi:hypothetical protein|nr:type IX secretion system protein PorQ [Bacteroidales bacterium]